MKARLQSFFKTNYDIRVNCLFVYSIPETLNALINVYKLINKTGSIEARTVFTEGRTGGVCRTVHEQKKQRITDHGYQNFIFPNHGNKQVRYSF